jgi:hypothetical protein
MRLRLTLTILSDLDLLALSSVPEFNFKNWVRDSLRTYAGTGVTRKVPLPASAPPELSLQSITYSITFDKHKDKTVESWLKSIKKKQRSGAIKTVLRCSLENPCLFAHYDTFPATFLALPPEKGHIAAKEAGRDYRVSSKEVISGTPVSQPVPVPVPEEDDDFDIFSMSMDIE